MGYIRSNEEYYRSIGYSADEARIAGVMADRGISDDEGFCNPIKLRLVEEARADIAAELGITYPAGHQTLPLIEIDLDQVIDGKSAEE